MLKTKVLKMLRESEGYVSGQQLCEQFKVSRTAIWKVINQLKEEGYQVEAVRNKGYYIADSHDIMGTAEIQSVLDSKWAGQQVIYYDETDSTNTQAKKLGEQGAVHGTLVVSDRQTAGKGRRGKSWKSVPGTGIYMSLLLRPEIEPSKAPMLTLVMAYSVAEAIGETIQAEVKIKWPNDLVLNRKKICGILTEMSTEIDYINHVVIGVGINVNATDFEQELSIVATSLEKETGAAIKRSTLLALVLKRFEKNYELFLRTTDLTRIYKGYNELLINCGSEVKILSEKEEYHAQAIGIDKTGELLVKKADGTTKRVFAGEVSVRGVYGYV